MSMLVSVPLACFLILVGNSIGSATAKTLSWLCLLIQLSSCYGYVLRALSNGVI